MSKIEKSVELSIRRGYSKDLNRLTALSRWILSTLHEMAAHDDRIYACKVRLKTIESFLEKISADPEKVRIIRSYTGATRAIDDLVGARIISYLSSSLEGLHQEITSFHRMRLLKVTVHDQEDHPAYEAFIKSLESDCAQRSGIFAKSDVSLEVRLNSSGYTGFHYVFEPKPVDPFYKKEPVLYKKFELQLRTIIQEAWSEVNHGVIYKGRSRYQIKRQKSASLRTLAGVLRACDSAMSDIANAKRI